jgi:purine-nucleoside phosphorylase
MRTPYQLRLDESVSFLRHWARDEFCPDVALVLGSGLSGVFDEGSYHQRISYNDLPGFKTAAVKGHAGEVGLLRIEGVQVLVLRGRVHAYEGYDPGEVTHSLRTAIHWGATKVILTNAAGCLVPDWDVGRVMLITDQINASGLNPLASPYGDGFGPRFVDMTQAYSAAAVQLAKEVFGYQNEPVYEGVYYGVAGPTYETPAEVRLFRQQGGHAVGMSTVLETIAARQMGAQLLGLSCLTNAAAGLKPGALAHEDVLVQGKSIQGRMAKVLPALIKGFHGLS